MTIRCLFAALLVAPVAVADGPSPAQSARQKESMTVAEQTARRLTTSLRVLAYQKLDLTAEHRTLEEVATGLRKLGREDMAAVLGHLDKAITATDPTTASAEERLAYAKHRAVVARLRSLVGRADAVGGLEEAVRRMSDLAKKEHDLYLTSAKAIRKAAEERGNRRGVDLQLEAADAQGDLRTDLMALAKHVEEMTGSLNPDQRDRLNAVNLPAKVAAVAVQMEEAQKYTAAGRHQPAAEAQEQAARDLQSLAAALTEPADPSAALRVARTKVEQVRAAQEELQKATATEPDFGRQAPGRGGKPTSIRRQEHNAALADRQARLKFQARDARKAVEVAAADLAPRMRPVEAEMSKAEDDLRSNRPSDAGDPQREAVESLAAVGAELDQKLVAAEQAKNDPAVAARKTAEAVGQLLNEQKATSDQTKSAKSEAEQKNATSGQKGVARKAESLNSMTPPQSTAARKALTDAAKAAGQAASELDKNNRQAAAGQQDAAVKSLEEAKAALEAHATAIEKQQAEVAALEAGLKVVDELGEKERQLAAEAAAGKSGNTQAEAQKAVASQTQKAADQLKELSPEAAAALAQAAKDAAEAAQSFGEQNAAAAGQKAQSAATKMDQAKQALGNKLASAATKQLNDQGEQEALAAAEAARQVAKAIEQTDRAVEAAKSASVPLSDSLRSLAQAQKAVADTATGDAKSHATAAASAIESGNLPAAVAAQRQAAGKLGATPAGERQRTILKATEKLLESAEATAAARAAVNQAQAAAPRAAQNPLQAAGQNLSEAEARAATGDPASAARSQVEAGVILRKTLEALNAAAEAAGLPASQPGESQVAQAAKPSGQPSEQGNPQQGQPADGEGNDPSQKPGGKASGQEQDGNPASGDRRNPGKGNTTRPQGRDQSGNSSFINLQKIDREKVQQSIEAAFPPVFRELIKQYHINVKDQTRTPRK